MAGLLGNRTIGGLLGSGSSLLGGVGDFFQNQRDTNPGALSAIGVGLMRGDLASGFEQADEVQRHRIELEKQEQLRRDLMAQDASQFGQSFGLQQAEFGMKREALASELQQKKLIGSVTAKGIRGWGPEFEPYAAMADAGMGAEALELADKARRASMKGGGEFGLQPVPIQLPDGSYAIGQLGKDGSTNIVDFGNGARPYNPAEVSQAKSLGTTVGKGMGEAQTALPGAEGTAARVSAQIQDLKADPYLDRMVGAVDSRLGNWSSDAARVQSKMNQLQGGAFLEARQMLKGGGAITDFEGRKAEEAFARLNAAQNETDYRAALDEFEYYTKQGLAKLQQQAGGSGRQPSGMGIGNGQSQGGGMRSKYGLE